MRNVIRIVAVVVAAIAIRYFCIEPFRANVILGNVEEVTARAERIDPVAAAELVRGNLSDLASIERAERLDPSWYLLYGANLELAGRELEAAQAYSRALLIDQRPEIYANRGLLEFRHGQIDAAVSDLATAARFNPNVLDELDGVLRSRVAAAAGIH